MEAHLRRLEAARVPRRVRHVLEKDVGLVHGKRLFVVLGEVPRRLGVEHLGVGQADHLRRGGPVGVLREALVAVEVSAGLRVLGEVHDGHVVQQGAEGFLLQRQLLRQGV